MRALAGDRDDREGVAERSGVGDREDLGVEEPVLRRVEEDGPLRGLALREAEELLEDVLVLDGLRGRDVDRPDVASGRSRGPCR